MYLYIYMDVYDMLRKYTSIHVHIHVYIKEHLRRICIHNIRECTQWWWEKRFKERQKDNHKDWAWMAMSE